STFTADAQRVSPEISTYNNQQFLIGPEEGTTQQNPFQLLTITFTVVGSQGDTSPVAVSNLSLSSRWAVSIPHRPTPLTQIRLGDDGGSLQSVFISGRITYVDTCSVASGVAVLASGGQSTTTNANGDYSLQVPGGFSGT